MADTIQEIRKKKAIQNVLSPVIAILGGLILGAIIMLAVGTNPIYAYAQMFGKSFFTPYYLAQTLVRSAPIMLAGVAAAVAWRAGYINLGMQGQMCVGGLCATLVALYFPVKTPLTTILCFIVGMAAGAIWALIPTFFDYKFNASLIITTLMLNYATNYITDYFVAYPIKDTAGDGMALQSPQIAEAMRFFRFSKKNAMNVSVFLAIAMVILVYFILKKTRFGYESKITGLNRNFASYGGIKSSKMMFMTMAFSGALCGFAACIEIFGARYRYVNAMFSSTSYAWTGLMAMLIAKYNPILTLVYSIFLAGLSIGGQALQRTVGLPMQISDIIQCCITLFVSVKIIIDFKHKQTPERLAAKGGKA
ncbi:MAG: ABC transporter permease [Sphaerochaetaceae bacterium]